MKKNMLNYKKQIEIEMKKLGATEEDLKLLKTTIINNAIKKNRNPKDVAWAILQ